VNVPAFKAKAKAGSAGKLLVITPEREKAALEFVQRNHPRLAELLEALKASSPREYERAVRELFRTSERLSLVGRRDAVAHDLELRLWKARTRAQILGARLQMGDDEGTRNQLREALEEEYDLRIQVLQRERDRVAERVSTLENQLERLRTQRDPSLAKQYETLTRAARPAAGKPAKKKSTKSPRTPPD
jgi:hypothetical protein